MSIVKQFTVHEDGTALMRARLEDMDGNLMTQADVATIEWWSIDKTIAASGELVIGTASAGVSLTVGDVVYDTAQDWTVDLKGYNFRHVVPATAFPNGSRTYRVQYKLVDTNGYTIWVKADCDTDENYI